MSKPWQTMSHEELTRELDAGRKEAAKRIAQLAELMGMSTGKGPGRPSKNHPLADLLSGGAGPESPDEDAANGAVQ